MNPPTTTTTTTTPRPFPPSAFPPSAFRPSALQAFPLCALLLSAILAAIVASPSLPAAAATIIDENFERSLPRGTAAYRLETAIDTAQARSGRSSLRISKEEKHPWGTYGFELDGRLNLSDGCEFSLWIYAAPGANASAYISGFDGTDRYTLVNATGAITPGQWSQVTGTIYPGDHRKDDREVRLIVRTHGTCWIDDVKLTSTRPDTPSHIWPRLETSLQTAANRRTSPLKPGDTLTLDARHAALAPDTARVATTLPTDPSVPIPAEGLLTFAIDAKDDLELTGTLELDPDADLRPGLRVTVLSGNTVIAAPAVKAPAWRGTRGEGDRPGPAPAGLRGEHPPSTIPLATFRMTKGRNYITIAGPHIRPGGTFAKLELRAADRPPAKPLCTFGLFSDIHIGFTRADWMNVKLNARAGGELEAALRQLKREDPTAFAILAGDMTDGGRRVQFEELARIIKRADLPVYGCLGNHDTFRNSRTDIAATIPKLFPDGPDKPDYAFTRPPLRFVVLDGAHWRGKDGSLKTYRAATTDTTTYREGLHDWLRDTLAADTTTPTIVVSHFEFYRHQGISPLTGYNLGNPSTDKKLMATLDAAPNVIATLNGHHHCNMVSTRNGITNIQNPALAEWPNAYRVFRVYPDRLEWEVRQIPNRGLIRESVIPAHALLWMLSYNAADLAGTLPLTPRKQ